MIYLDNSQKKFQDALELHCKGLASVVKQKKNDCGNAAAAAFLTDGRIEAILKAPPGNMLQLQKDYFEAVIPGFSQAEWEHYFRIRKKKKRQPDEIEIFNRYTGIYTLTKQIFDYESYFAKKDKPYSAYDLADNLNVNTCPYCNRLYTKTVVKPKKITRPEFDHWFAKNSYPLLALSFFNLIPSCHVCNSTVKGSSEMNIGTHLHPYIDHDIDFKFSYYNKSLNTYGFKIKTTAGTKSDNTAKAFKLKEIYETHEDEIADLRKIKEAYSERYLEILSGQYKGLTISEDEIYRLAFGVYKDEKDFEKRPLSKMKRDILTELGIIKKSSP